MKTIAHNLLLFAALALPALCAAQPKPTDDPQRNLQKFDNFYRYLNMTYVDTVHNGQLVENAKMCIRDRRITESGTAPPHTSIA